MTHTDTPTPAPPIDRGDDPRKVYELICEGRCNPNIAAIDDVVRRSFNLMDGLSNEARVLQRTLKYTRHVSFGGDFARCLVCGVVRKY